MLEETLAAHGASCAANRLNLVTTTAIRRSPVDGSCERKKFPADEPRKRCAARCSVALSKLMRASSDRCATRCLIADISSSHVRADRVTVSTGQPTRSRPTRLRFRPVSCHKTKRFPPSSVMRAALMVVATAIPGGKVGAYIDDVYPHMCLTVTSSRSVSHSANIRRKAIS
jgi:hypothetical protein